MLNKQKGNMYDFVTHTWNTVKGRCPHGCEYCYMRRFPLGPVHFDTKELKTDLGEGNFIFVGSSCDMWAEVISFDWIDKTLQHCCEYQGNTYLFQSKNPVKFFESSWDVLIDFPKNVVLGTTIETNRKYSQMGKAPDVIDRVEGITCDAKKMVTIEPIMDFDIEDMVCLIKAVSPEWVNIGVDSGGNHLPEPPAGKILELIEALKEFTEVRGKKNLSRLLGKED